MFFFSAWCWIAARKTVIWKLQPRNELFSCTLPEMLSSSLIEVQTMAVFYIIFPYMLPWLKAVKRRRLMIHVLFWLQATTFLSIASWLSTGDWLLMIAEAVYIISFVSWVVVTKVFFNRTKVARICFSGINYQLYIVFHCHPLSFFSLFYWPWNIKSPKKSPSWGSSGLLRYGIPWIQRVLLDGTCLATKPNPCLCYGMPFSSGANAWWRCKVDVMTWVFPKNIGTPKSSILIGFSIINHPFWGPPIFGTSTWYPNVSCIYLYLVSYLMSNIDLFEVSHMNYTYTTSKT